MVRAIKLESGSGTYYNGSQGVFATVGGTTQSQETPFNGSPFAIPGKIPAAQFDNGGEGVAYHDSDPANDGGQYRNTGVDIETCTEGGYDVGWIGAGEWDNYTVNVASAGSYDIQA